MVETIRNAAKPPAASDRELCLALRSACDLAAAVAGEAAVEAALALLPPVVRARFSGLAGKANIAFVKLYEALVTAEPAL